MMGFETPGDQRVPVSVREWTSMKLAIWRGRYSGEIVMRQASAILDRCRHEPGCPGATIETEPCFSGCPDREIRMSALVALNAARQFAPIHARRPNEPYFAPSRERFSEVIAELGATQVECAAMRALLEKLGVEIPKPPPQDAEMELTLPEEEAPKLTEADLEEPDPELTTEERMEEIQ